jgi:hypothetical protein
MWGLAGIGIVVFGISIWNSIGRNLDFPWTSIRLAPAFALAHGIPLYSMPDKSPWVMVGYGPLYPLAYLPSVMAHHPQSAVAIATILAHFYVLAPAGLIFSLLGKQLGGDNAPRVHWLFFLLLFALVTHLAPSLTYVTARVHVDAPAVGFFLLACYAIWRGELAAPDSRTRWLLGAGIAAGLSAACKINFAAVALALAIWTWRFSGWKRASMLFASSFAAALAVYALAAWHDGLSPVLLNLTQPGKMPWFILSEIEPLTLSDSTSTELSEKLRTFLSFTRDYLKVYGPIALGAILPALLLRRDDRDDRTTGLVRFFLVISLLLSPISIASVSKYGGDVNNRALVSVPLLFAAMFALASLTRRSPRVVVVAILTGLACAIFMVALPLKERIKKVSKTTPILVESYRVIARDPGRWYYPYDPLAHMLVEGKFRPNMDVIYSYSLSGFPVDATAFQAALPENLRYVAIPPAAGSWGASEIRRLLSNYSRPVPELSTVHHRVYSR